MSGEETSSSKSKRLRDEGRDKSVESKGTSESLDAIRNKVFLLPEIMEKILGHLDMRSLKQVRLVCKRWLHQAQSLLERRGIVNLVTPGRFNEDERFPVFFETCKSKTPSLPMPFKALSVVLSDDWDKEADIVFSQLLSLPPPLVITRLDTEELPPNVVVPLFIRASSSLEYIHLSASGSWPEMYPLKSTQLFPKLRYIHVETEYYVEDTVATLFPSLVAWLVSSSPNLETYEYREWSCDKSEFVSAVMMSVDIRNVKAFRFQCYSNLSNAALSHLRAIPFTRLETLKLDFLEESTGAEETLRLVVANSFMTLKELDLFDVKFGEEAQARFPVCPNVQQLRVMVFPHSNNILSNHFPSLQTLTIDCSIEEMATWSDDAASPPWLGLKRLRIKDSITTQSDQSFIKLFENLPSLEYLFLENTNFKFGCSLISEWMPKSLNFLQGVKHLVVHQTSSHWWCKDYVGWYAFLSFLTGLESIEVNTTVPEIILTTLPVKEFPRLKVVQFPWDQRLDVRKLLKLTRGLEKVLISNCCSVLRRDGYRSNHLLQSFFDSAANAECGCGVTRRVQWFPEEQFVSAAEGF